MMHALVLINGRHIGWPLIDMARQNSPPAQKTIKPPDHNTCLYQCIGMSTLLHKRCIMANYTIVSFFVFLCFLRNQTIIVSFTIQALYLSLSLWTIHNIYVLVNHAHTHTQIQPVKTSIFAIIKIPIQHFKSYATTRRINYSCL